MNVNPPREGGDPAEAGQLGAGQEEGHVDEEQGKSNAVGDAGGALPIV